MFLRRADDGRTECTQNVISGRFGLNTLQAWEVLPKHFWEKSGHRATHQRGTVWLFVGDIHLIIFIQLASVHLPALIEAYTHAYETRKPLESNWMDSWERYYAYVLNDCMQTMFFSRWMRGHSPEAAGLMNKLAGQLAQAPMEVCLSSVQYILHPLLNSGVSGRRSAKRSAN